MSYDIKEITWDADGYAIPTDSIVGQAEAKFGNIYRNLIRTHLEASERIARNAGVDTPTEALRAFYGRTVTLGVGSKTDLVVTDMVDRFLPSGDFYYVTTSKAVKYLSQNKNIMPPVFHELDVLTHRGKAQIINDRFMRCLGIPESGAAFPESSLGYKQMFIFASPSGDIDGQAFAIEDVIARHTPQENDHMFYEVFFDNADNPLHLHKNLIAIIDKLNHGEKIVEPELLSCIGKVQDVLFQTLGIRFNWYDRIGQILRGEIKTPRIADASTVEDLLLMPSSNYYDYGEGSNNPHQAVILKINREKAIGDRKIAILPIDDRNWNKVAMLPKISPDSVTVYSRSEDLAYGLPWAPLSDLPNTMFINEVGPGRVDLKNFQPSKALCGSRYGNEQKYAHDVIKLWREQMERGKVVSLGGLQGNHLDHDKTHLTNILKSILDPKNEEPISTISTIFDYGFPRFGSHLNFQ